MNIDNLRKQLRGTVLLPGSEEYESSRRIWNAMIDRRPRAIACCSGPADVQAAVRFAVEEDIFLAIRGGGHNAAGLAMIDDGLVIDVSRMKGIFVEPAAQTATAQAGLTWGEFDRETHAYGLATTGGLISTTGIAGLTLGGGVGWLMGRCGLVCDNTLNYDIVLANGTMTNANASENADLFWALKGGGGNFGVVTSITYRMYPIREVLAGLLLYPLASARDVIRFYRDFTSGAIPDELTMYVAALQTPDGLPVVALIPVWCGDLEEGERILKPVRAFGAPIAGLDYAHALSGYTADDRWGGAVRFAKLLEEPVSSRTNRRSDRHFRRVCRKQRVASLHRHPRARPWSGSARISGCNRISNPHRLLRLGPHCRLDKCRRRRCKHRMDTPLSFVHGAMVHSSRLCQCIRSGRYRSHPAGLRSELSKTL